jgi:acyl-CoA oxidase
MDALPAKSPCSHCNHHVALLTTVVGLLIAVYFTFRRKTKKADPATLALLTQTDPIPPECQPCIDALLSPPITKNEKECAEQMRALIQSGCLPYRSLVDRPELLLSMSQHTGNSQTNGALWTRFTVQYNLFAGSIVALGSDKQREVLFALESGGDLGCFAFTEAGAGVLSGAAFESTAVYNRDTKSFTLHCPTESSRKRWISQGLFAEYAVIAANLSIQQKDGTKGENLGPHLFFARIQNRNPSTGDLSPLPGVKISSVGLKTAGLGLDNAIIEFNNFTVPHESLLSRFSSINFDSGEHVTHFPGGVKRMLDLLITRLLTGRIVLSEYTVSTAIKIFRHNWEYCTQRRLYAKSPKTGQTMSELPLINAAFVDYVRCLGIVKFFMLQTRAKVAECIRTDKFKFDTIELTCISKFVGTGFSVDAVSVLRKLMGSQALFEESWLGESSFVCNATCAAEGDNTIMELKIVQDLFRGRTQLLPWKLFVRTFLSSRVGKRIVFTYLFSVAKAMILREGALKDGQLLKNLAWCRAHMLIIDTWLQGGNPVSWIDGSYADILVKFPMPVQC